MNTPIKQATHILKTGGIIAYPTEAVFGLGCDPKNNTAIEKLLALKARSADKGLLLVAANIEQCADYIQPLSDELFDKITQPQAHPTTWLLPSKQHRPLIQGEHAEIAIRFSEHTLVKELCLAFGGPIVSTSANVSGMPPADNYEDALSYWQTRIDFVVPGETNGLTQPSIIRHALTNKILRG